MEIIDQILTTLKVPEAARQIYIDLMEHGPSSARTISVRLSLSRPSVYDQLKILKTRGLVVERDRDGKTEFMVTDVRDLEKMVLEEKNHLSNLEKELASFQESLTAKTARTTGTEPKIKFITGREGIIQSMHDMLWDESLVLKVVWPYQAMLKTLGAKTLADFNQKRLKNNIRLQTIWAYGETATSHIWQGDDDRGVERRRAPKGITPQMGYTIYDHKVLFVSSAAESYGFTVQSADFADLMRQQFDLLWSISTAEKKIKK